MLKLYLHALVMLVLSTCGQQPQGSQIEYYIEEKTSQPGNDYEEDSDTNDSDATAKVNPSSLQLIINDPIEGASSDQLIINVNIVNPVNKASWTLYYSPKEDLSLSIEIETDIPMTQTQISWDVSQLNQGSYYLYAVVNVDDKELIFKYSTPIMIDEENTPVNRKPTLSLQFPLGENVFVVGTAQDIRWESSDPDNDPLRFKLEYSANDGTNWTTIADDIIEKTYAWNASGLSQGISYKIRVTATDDKGAFAVAASPRNFGVATTPMTFAGGFGALLNARCGACHNTGGPNQNQFRSNNFNLATIGVDAKQMNIKTRIENNTMPPRTALTAQEKEVLTMWLWDGAK